MNQDKQSQEKPAILYRRLSDCLEYYGQDGNELKYLGSVEADWIDKLSKKQCDALLEIFRESLDIVDPPDNPFFELGLDPETQQAFIDSANSEDQTVTTERQKVVLELIKRNPRIPYRQIAHELGINDSAVKKHLDKLKEAGLVERVGGTRGYWSVQE